ncbi:unnamed protein product (macronuclear) [Paramecium tetraurelia]|uniref:Cilium assembly protein DZIP1 N-terminal domain-containing protein n=1 Tax=Paramecium tetraurelia TaxID=5888 RepID=A0DI41_PARTE|nr:uncharacterized protein GSPATT00017079001 [Paramecium tetraurelia]CAK82708.1 unnamed protein product [Paramecium tetraurelia]|eukprot:XP_001450105.1 hypothetical protein (macronuclear) [Paramecium tetraurelia strain d4-2]
MNQLNSDLKSQIIEYFEELQNKLNLIGYSDIRVILPDDISVAFKYITRILDQFIELNQEITEQYELLEQSLQKIESENRYHIHVEQRLKIHCDSIQESLTQKDEQCRILQMKIDLQERQIFQLKKEIDVASRRRIETEKSVTDTQSRQYLMINGIPSQTTLKQIIKPKTRLQTETLEINKVRSISSLDYNNFSILIKRNDERKKRSSTIQIKQKK